jgi:mono/diheme cytochrome c family protein
MNLLKSIIIIFAFGCFAAACVSTKASRYAITNSKAYEASLFRQNCAICHGPEGEGKTLEDGRVIPNIRDGEHKYKTDAEIYNHIANGGNGMVPFRDILTEGEIRRMVDFVQKDLRQGN